MKTASFAAVIISLVLGSIPAGADKQEFTPAGMSGYATNALVRAYSALRFDEANAPPFNLQAYVVQLYVGGDIFQVSFLGQTVRSSKTAWVNCRTGAVATTSATAIKLVDNGPSDSEGFIVPGIIAGEIIAVYRYAASEGSISKQLDSGAFNLSFGARAGGAGVGFLVREQPQASVSIRPEPTPSPTPGGMRCIAGACGG